MLLFIFMVVVVAVGFIAIRHGDQRRWGRYQIERDMYFQMHPYQFNQELPFSIVVPLGRIAQRKLQNELMLKPNQRCTRTTAVIQRDAARQNQIYVVNVCIHDYKIGELEPKYAETLCLNLEKTDFFIGRPILLQAEIEVFQKSTSETGCRVKLNLPTDLSKVDQQLIEKLPENNDKTRAD